MFFLAFCISILVHLFQSTYFSPPFFVHLFSSTFFRPPILVHLFSPPILVHPFYPDALYKKVPKKLIFHFSVSHFIPLLHPNLCMKDLIFVFSLTFAVHLLFYTYSIQDFQLSQYSFVDQLSMNSWLHQVVAILTNNKVDVQVLGTLISGSSQFNQETIINMIIYQYHDNIYIALFLFAYAYINL